MFETDKLEVHVLELPKVKGGIYPESKLLYWARFLNSDTRREMEAMAVKDAYIEKDMIRNGVPEEFVMKIGRISGERLRILKASLRPM